LILQCIKYSRPKEFPLSEQTPSDDLMTVVYAIPDIVRGIRGTRRGSSTQSLTLPQIRALWRLAGEESLTMGELARRMGVSLASATQIVERLVELGFVQRERPEWDRRVVLVRLTGDASAAIRQSIERRVREVSEVFEQLTPEEARAFAKGCQLLAEVLLRD